jgi:hypothetical protein
MTLSKRVDTENWKMKHYIALRGELSVEKTVELPQERLSNELICLRFKYCNN